MLYSLRQFNSSEVAKQRMKIVEFYKQYGEKATKEAFGADRKVISRWRQRLSDYGLIRHTSWWTSTRPNCLCTSCVPHQIVNFIRELREKHPHCPKINTYIERYNRTLQEEFIDNHLDIIHDKSLFNPALADYLIYPHTNFQNYIGLHTNI